jgi:hypothetical protein
MSQFTQGPWLVNVRENRAGNLTIEVALKGIPHAEFVLQENGTVDVGTKGRQAGWDMPNAPSPDLKKFRFSP